MAAQYIFTMRDLRRFHPPDREVLKGINLSSVSYTHLTLPTKRIV